MEQLWPDQLTKIDPSTSWYSRKDTEIEISSIRTQSGFSAHFSVQLSFSLREFSIWKIH